MQKCRHTEAADLFMRPQNLACCSSHVCDRDVECEALVVHEEAIVSTKVHNEVDNEAAQVKM